MATQILKAGRSTKQVRMMAVVVLYKMEPCASPTLRTLLQASSAISSSQAELAILVRDNTPGGQITADLPIAARYEAAPDNPGLASAYNRGLEIARTEGYDWLLTLDQDTLLPDDFLLRMSQLAAQFDASPEVAAIVPRITGDGRALSPFRFVLGAIPRWYPEGFTGILQPGACAVNSAALLRVAALELVGGYDPVFPLDISDINLFYKLYRSGKRVFLAGDLSVSHDFSILKKQQRMSLARYRSMLLDECAFWDIHMSFLGRSERLFRLAGRACKEVLRSEESAFRRVTLGELRRRIVTPKAQRIAQWKEWSAARTVLSQSTMATPRKSAG